MTVFQNLTKYTTGREPVLTVNVVAALGMYLLLDILGRLGIVFEPEDPILYIIGFVFFSGATWLARRGVWSPQSHEEVVDAALHTAPPDLPGQE